MRHAGVTERRGISLVATVRNEMPGLRHWLAALERQTLEPDEIVVVDGGSTDGTWEALCEASETFRPPMQVISAPGASISVGRNIAVDASAGDIVAVTDAGTVADPRWLERLIGALGDREVDVAAGFFVPELESIWQRSLAAATLPDADDIDPSTFMPSSRSVAFRASWFQNGIRYPEWLDYGEDLVWDLSMRRAGARFRFVPDALVTFRVRDTARDYVLQYYRYARGDGKAGLFPRRHVIRYATYLGLFTVLIRRRWIEALAAALLGAAYVATLLRRAWRRDRQRGLPVRATLLALPHIAGLRGLGDMSKMVGYPVGLLWRWRRYGALGSRTSWRRISPSGRLWRPGSSTIENRTPTSSRGV